ncbi:type II toxin-antitoxin system RelE/ParE family toxin [Novosphingobium huizhouense]|uniref:type II toxin-antitoxin system RelE/ParE family toxin n=1 Tax=Novosphingobium huizhouense TaxID=2866625 RepID=UPI001CD90B2A|nr:type II toxin-antitoxin system RelE/ParE family toxin [Novosphingobium huizhouense]
MEIASIRHKALRRFAIEGRAKGLIEPDRLRDMLAYIDAAGSFEELALPPNFGLHPLTGDRAGCWAMTVARNWRLTFTRIGDHAIGDLDLEDYH